MEKDNRAFKKRAFRFVIPLMAVVAIAFIVLAVHSERERARALGAMPTTPEARVHGQLATLLDEAGASDATTLPSELRPKLDAIARWKTVLQRYDEEVDAEFHSSDRFCWSCWTEYSPEAIADIGRFLETHQDFLRTLRTTAAQGGPMVAVPLPPNSVDPSHTLKARYLARLLALDLLYQARHGDPNVAVDDAVAGLELGFALAEVPTLFSQTARFSCSLITCQAIAAGFPPGTLPDGAYSKLLHTIERDPGRTPMVAATLELGTTFLSEFDALRNKGWLGRYNDLGFIVDSPLPTFFGKAHRLAYASPLARPWWNWDASNLAALATEISPHTALPLFEAEERYAVGGPGLGPNAQLFVQSVHNDLVFQASHEAHVRLLVLGLTLEQHPSPPESLAAITDVLPQETFVDPFTGGPVHYRVTGSRFVLYSVGKNRQDDHGWHNYREGDLVWRGKLDE